MNRQQFAELKRNLKDTVDVQHVRAVVEWMQQYDADDVSTQDLIDALFEVSQEV